MENNITILHIGNHMIQYENKGKELNQYTKDCITAAIHENHKTGTVYGNRRKVIGKWKLIITDDGE